MLFYNIAICKFLQIYTYVLAHSYLLKVIKCTFFIIKRKIKEKFLMCFSKGFRRDPTPNHNTGFHIITLYLKQGSWKLD